jgi:hypothetical protein
MLLAITQNVKYRRNTEELRCLCNSSHEVFLHHFVLLKRSHAPLVHATIRLTVWLPACRNCIHPIFVTPASPKAQDEGSSRLDEIYRGYRIATKFAAGIWTARISHVRGSIAPISAKATDAEGDAACMARARDAVDGYIRYLANDA